MLLPCFRQDSRRTLIAQHLEDLQNGLVELVGYEDGGRGIAYRRSRLTIRYCLTEGCSNVEE